MNTILADIKFTDVWPQLERQFSCLFDENPTQELKAMDIHQCFFDLCETQATEQYHTLIYRRT